MKTAASLKLARQTAAIAREADAAFARYSCPSSSECCQLTKVGRQPWLYPSEWSALEVELKSQGRDVPPGRSDGSCPFLDEQGKRCTVYAARPVGCRTFFCGRATGPSRQPLEAMNALLSRLHDAHVEAENDEAPRPLLEWHGAALAQGRISR